MKQNGRMGLIDRIFKGGKEKGGELPPLPGPTPAQASTQFYESEPDSEDSHAPRSAPRRELVQVMLRDTMRKHGIPSDWIECRVLSAVTRTGRRGLHVNFVVLQAHEQLLPYVFAFQDSFERELSRFEPRWRDWLMSLGWEFTGFKHAEMPDATNWSHGVRMPEPLPGGAMPARAVPEPVEPEPEPHESEPAEAESARSDDEIQQDLEALFAIRDAALADAAGGQGRGSGQPDFEPTQPSGDVDPPRP
jgi:hypothetical protein